MGIPGSVSIPIPSFALAGVPSCSRVALRWLIAKERAYDETALRWVPLIKSFFYYAEISNDARK